MASFQALRRKTLKKEVNLKPEKCDKVTLVLWKNLGFQLFSPKTRRRKTFVHRKFRNRSLTTLSMQLRNKQTDPTNAFVENERQS